MLEEDKKFSFRKVIKRIFPMKVVNFFVKIISYVYIKYYRIFFKKIKIRPNTSDLNCFRQIFIQKDYNIEPRTTNIKTIVDCGANVGYASLYFSKKYPSAKIFAIEPEEENFKALKVNCSGIKNIKAIKAAVWSENTSLNIFDPDRGEWGFQTKQTKDKNQKAGRVSAITIAEIMKKNKIKQIDILKIDIEGAEDNLFSKNFESWLDKTNTLIIELHDWIDPKLSKNFYKAIKGKPFRTDKRGENIILSRNR